MPEPTRITLSESNYYSKQADIDYMSVSQVKSFIGVPAKPKCEARAVAELNGEYQRPQTDALTIGSFIDISLTGTDDELEQFKLDHPEMFSTKGATKGQLKATFRRAQDMISRVNTDADNGGIFKRTLQGEQQKVVIGEINGFVFKGKLDVLGDGYIVDLKTTESINKKYYANGWYNFIDYWGYDLQGAVYQQLVFQNTGKQLPFFIAAISKEDPPDIGVFQIPQENMDAALERIDAPTLQRIQDLKNGSIKPDRCGKCDYCRATKIVDKPTILEVV